MLDPLLLVRVVALGDLGASVGFEGGAELVGSVFEVGDGAFVAGDGSGHDRQ